MKLIKFYYMSKKNENVDDRSRNGSNAESFPKWENLSFIKKVETTLEEPDLVNGYSLWRIRYFFSIHRDFSDFVVCNNEKERQQSNEFLERVTNCIDFNCRLRANVINHFRHEFTSNQLACISHVYKFYLPCAAFEDLYPKWLLFEYIDNEGKNTYDLDYTEAFKARIQSINQIEYEVFVNSIIELFEMKEDLKALEFEYLAKDGRKIGEIRKRREEDFKKKHINELKEICEANRHKSGYIKVNVKPDYTPDDDGFQFIELHEYPPCSIPDMYKNNSYVMVYLFWELTTITEVWKIYYDKTYPEIEN